MLVNNAVTMVMADGLLFCQRSASDLVKSVLLTKRLTLQHSLMTIGTSSNRPHTLRILTATFALTNFIIYT